MRKKNKNKRKGSEFTGKTKSLKEMFNSGQIASVPLYQAVRIQKKALIKGHCSILLCCCTGTDSSKY